jgi:hypothetical protein
MSDLYWLTDEEMARLQPYCPKSHSKTRVDDRRALSSIVFVNRNRYGGVIGRSRCSAQACPGPVEGTLYNR